MAIIFHHENVTEVMSYHLTLALALSFEFLYSEKEGILPAYCLWTQSSASFGLQPASPPAGCGFASPPSQLHGPIKLPLLCPGSKPASPLLWLPHDSPGPHPSGARWSRFDGTGETWRWPWHWEGKCQTAL